MPDAPPFEPFFCGACQRTHAPSDPPQCLSCRYYERGAYCVRRAPVANASGDADWPSIRDPWRWWCGEYRVHGLDREATDD